MLLPIEAFPQWIRFAFVGCVGFVIDAGLLALFVHGLGWEPLPARVISFLTAVLGTWWLNRTITFKVGCSSGKLRNLQMYFVVSLLGFALNFATYAELLRLSSTVYEYPLLGLVPSAAVSAVFTYWGNVRMAFRG